MLNWPISARLWSGNLSSLSFPLSFSLSETNGQASQRPTTVDHTLLYHTFEYTLCQARIPAPPAEQYEANRETFTHTGSDVVYSESFFSAPLLLVE